MNKFLRIELFFYFGLFHQIIPLKWVEKLLRTTYNFLGWITTFYYSYGYTIIPLASLQREKVTNLSWLSCDLSMPYLPHLFPSINSHSSYSNSKYDLPLLNDWSLSIIPCGFSPPDPSVFLSTAFFYCLEHVIVYETLAVELAPLVSKSQFLESPILPMLFFSRKSKGATHLHFPFGAKQRGWWWTWS